MKKVSLILLAAALSATATLAQSATEPVYSQNAVGFINKTVEAGTYAVLTFPFVDMAATNDLIDFDSQQIAKDATRGSIVYFWDGTGWDGKVARNNGFNTGKQLLPGEMFMYKPAAQQTVVLCGEVPDAGIRERAVVGAANYTACGNPYPVATEFDTSNLATNAHRGAIAYFWDGAGWDGKVARNNGFNTGKILEPGEGFLYKTASTDSSVTWIVDRPYEFPAAKE